MFQALKDLFTSKKFLMTVGGSVACATLSHFNAPDVLISTIATLTGCGVVGQGLADFGKNAKK